MKAFSLALYYLERRARTGEEVRLKLGQKQIPAQEIEAALAGLKARGLVNDAKFATDWQRQRNDYKPMGVHRLRLELRRKGLPKEIIATVSTVKADECRLAEAAAETRLRLYANLEPAVMKRRLTGFLVRRGFGYEIIKYVLENLKKT